MRIKSKTKKEMKAKVSRIIAAFLAINILFEAIAPTCAFALTGGPSQPEVQAFTPVGTSDMVDPFSGDFSYNIPLMDVDGYPINIGYSSGISMDQEASWTGLGWNINPGVINRGTRGIPDDFNGDEIVKEYKMKANKTYGLNVGAGIELFGLQKLKVGIGYTLGIKYNNYNGFGAEQSLNLSLSAGKEGSSPLSGGLGLNSSSDDGLTLQPSVSLSGKISKDDNITTSLSVGGAFNSRGGLKAMTIGVSQSKSFTEVDKKGKEHNNSRSGQVASSSFDFGMPTYTPSGGLPMQNLSITGNFKLGAEAWGLHPNVSIGGYYSAQQLSTNIVSNPAYGYMNADEGTKYDNAVLDFNREKDGAFTPSTPALAIPNFTYDVLSISGQGVGGSYRPFRSDLGHVYDASTSTTSDGYSLGAEVGIGGIFHFGADFTMNNVDGKTGRWKNDNYAASLLTHKATSSNPLYEKYYFKEANEKSVDTDPEFFKNAAGFEARSIYLKQLSKFDIKADKYYTSPYVKLLSNGNKKYFPNEEIKSQNTTRKSRERRNQPLTMITRGELAKYGLEERVVNLTTLGNAPENAKKHHMAEITTLRNDGARYVYGIAVYNTKQEEVTFAVGRGATDGNNNSPARTASLNTGLVTYNNGDNEISNSLGKDNYYSNTKTPAFAHSYVLTAVLSPDYVDSDNITGPSDGDIGSYTKITYSAPKAYKWRTPVGDRQASYSEGLLSDASDDKANYIYGEKNLVYVDSIITKNYIAVFTLEDRKDGYGVQDKNGKRATSNPMKLLRKISLYSKFEYRKNPSAAVPIKTVNFVYDYSLCGNLPNNSGEIEYDENGKNINEKKGKLTLRKIYFTYQNSNKARLSPYEFTYSSTNPDYHIKGYDRWGNYKVNSKELSLPGATPTVFEYSSEFPYVEQNKALADNNAQAWTLKEVYLPSGGKIKVEYESDDYAYVQNKQAGQMFKIVGFEPSAVGNTSFNDPTELAAGTPFDINGSDGIRLIVKLQEQFTTTNSGAQSTWNQKFRDQYLSKIDYLYFKMFMRIQENGLLPDGSQPSKYNRDEYVSGYLVRGNNLGKSNSKPYFDVDKSYVSPNGQYACIYVPKVGFKDDSGSDLSPISKTAIQFGRLNMSKQVWTTQAVDETLSMEGLLGALANSSFFKNLSDMASGGVPNGRLFNYYNIGKKAFAHKSWIRLNNPNKKKLGGGLRVKKIVISDEWDGAGISNNPTNANTYGQEYSYTLADGTSSGVASYEPQLGGDENPWKKPVFFSEKKLMAPDDAHYMEEPFGESFFPSPSVGYSRVTIKNLSRTKDSQGNTISVKHNATGKVVHEFFTAKDFPTIAERTDLQARREKVSPLSLTSLFKLKSRDYMTASQGYVIELNDMHGKPKKQEVFQEGQNTPITSVEYVYKSTTYDGSLGSSGTLGSRRLSNTVSVINSDGSVNENATTGVFFDYVADMRESTNETTSASIAVNTDGFLIAIFPVVVPIVLPSLTQEKTQFRSAVITKVIQRFGILEETIAKDLGSVVSTKNLAYDAETGDVLLTETVTDFNDKVYSLNFPAYWYYDGMGPAYKNIDFNTKTIAATGVVVSGTTNSTGAVNNAMLYFAEGDEISLKDLDPISPIPPLKGWIKTVGLNSIEIIDRSGNPVPTVKNNINGIPYEIKVIRSGRRNQQGVPMASVTALTNPLNNIQANMYENVLQAQAMEYTNSWRTFCDCFQGSSQIFSDNPYIMGTKGMYKNKRSSLHLSGRTQSNYNGNTNIRKDGVLTTYNPFYKLNEGKWEIDNKNWTYTSEVTEFSPFGMELENKDALGRFSAATYGYAQSLPTAEAANARYRDIGFDNFEDYDYKTCADNHFKFPVSSNAVSQSQSQGQQGLSQSQGPQRSYYYNEIDATQSHTGKYSIKVTAGGGGPQTPGSAIVGPINMIKQLAVCSVDPCNISVSSASDAGSTFCFTITGGAAPYQYEWEFTPNNIDLAVTVSGTGNQICVKKPPTGTTYKIILTVTDSKNCKKIFTKALAVGIDGVSPH